MGDEGTVDSKQKDKQFQRADRISKRTTEIELLRRFDAGKQDAVALSRYLTPGSWHEMMREEANSATCAEGNFKACMTCPEKCRGFHEQLFAIMLANSSMNLELDRELVMCGKSPSRKYEALADAIDTYRQMINRCVSHPFLQYTRDPSVIQDLINDILRAYHEASGAQIGRIVNVFLETVTDEIGKNTIPIPDRKWIYPDDGKKHGGKLDINALMKLAGGGA